MESIDLMRQHRRNEHKRRLEEDSEYLEEFLKATTLKNEDEAIVENLLEIYSQNDCREELPTDLLGIIERARLATEEEKRSRIDGSFGWISTHDPKNPQPGSYYLLRDYAKKYLYRFKTDKEVTFEEGLKRIENRPLFSTTEACVPLCLLALTNSNVFEGLLTVVFMPYIFTRAVVEDFREMTMSKEKQAKRLVSRINAEYCEERKQAFESYKVEWEGVFEKYKIREDG